MTQRGRITIAAGAGVVWAVMLLWVAARFVTLPVFTLMPTIMTAFMAPGLVLAMMVARVVLRRYGDAAMLEGGALQGPAALDQRVLQNTVEQLAIALCIWPAAAIMLGDAGPGAIMVLGLGFALMRLVYWVGYHCSTPLRVFGFAGSFAPTVLVALWALLRLGTGVAG